MISKFVLSATGAGAVVVLRRQAAGFGTNSRFLVPQLEFE